MADRLNTIEHFRAFQGRLLGQRDLNVPTIVIPAGTCGRASGSNELISAAEEALSAGSLAGKVRLRITGCHGFCQMEPSVLVDPARAFYPRVDPENMARIIGAAAQRRVIEGLLFEDPVTGKPIRRQDLAQCLQRWGTVTTVAS